MDGLLTMLVLAALSALTAIIIIYVRRKKSRRQASSPSHRNIRMPKPVTAPLVSSNQVLVAGVHRSPHPADDHEYLTYRKCPDCRSKNTLSMQVIYKVGERSYECRRCGKKFNL